MFAVSRKYQLKLGDGSFETLEHDKAVFACQDSANELIRIAKLSGVSVARLSRCNCPASKDAVVSIKRIKHL